MTLVVPEWVSLCFPNDVMYNFIIEIKLLLNDKCDLLI